jgi:hypothetical protein
MEGECRCSIRFGKYGFGLAKLEGEI